MTEPTPGTTVDGREPQATPGTTADGSPLTDQEKQELEALRANKQQWLGEKSKYEQAQAELAEARARIEAMHSPPPTSTPVDPITANVQAGYMNLLQKALVEQDPDAQFQLAMLQGQQQALAKAQREAVLAALPSDERTDVDAVLQRAPNLDVQTARNIAAGERAQRRLKEYETREAEARKLAEEQARASTAGVTAVRSAPAPPQNSQMKASEFNRKFADLKAKSESGDLNARREARELGRKLDTGEISLVYNE